jgi:hypothetical protein
MKPTAPARYNFNVSRSCRREKNAKAKTACLKFSLARPGHQRPLLALRFVCLPALGQQRFALLLRAVLRHCEVSVAEIAGETFSRFASAFAL